MGSQLIIQIVLIAALLLIAAVLLLPRKGARSLALRRLTTLALLIAGIAAVINPHWLSWLAGFVGIGRGTDLLLYVFIIVFMGHTVTAGMRASLADQQITQLARELAILNAPDPNTPPPPVDEPDAITH